MELAFLLRGVGTEVYWVTTMKQSDTDEVTYSLEHKMLDRGVQVQNLKLISFYVLFPVSNRFGFSVISHHVSNNAFIHLQVVSENGQDAVNTALKADLVVLNTAVSGKWLDVVLKENVPTVLPKVLWWIHEMRGHYFKLDYVKHLPLVAGSMIDSHVTAEYWENRTRERLG